MIKVRRFTIEYTNTSILFFTDRWPSFWTRWWKKIPSPRRESNPRTPIIHKTIENAQDARNKDCRR